MKTIIVATNFSKASLHAASYAADMAVATKAALVLLHIIQMPGYYDVPLTEYAYDTILQGAEERLATLKKQLLIRTENEISISTKAILGSMQFEIEKTCENSKPFIVVIGTDTGGRAQRFFLGSDTFTIIKNLRYPVLVVPQNAIFRHIKRIGLAADLKNIFEIRVEVLRELAEMFGASVDIIHVSRNKEDEIKSRVALSLLKDRLHKFDPETHVIISDNVEQAINNYAEENHEDLLMVIPRQRQFPASLLHKSESKQLTLHPSIPVLATAE